VKQTFNSLDKIGDVVARFSKAGEIFMEYNIDFCCGGNRTLSVAINEQNLNENEMIDRLNSAYEEMKSKNIEDRDWTKEPLSEIIDYVVNTHHAYLQKELPNISKLVTTILRVHGVDHGDVLSRVHKLFHSLKMELEQHLIKEETILFPIIKEYEKNPSQELLDKGIKVMRETENEHEGAGDIIKELRKITNQFTAPPSGCTTFCLTYEKLSELESDLFQHIHLENNILFPRFEKGDLK